MAATAAVVLVAISGKEPFLFSEVGRLVRKTGGLGLRKWRAPLFAPYPRLAPISFLDRHQREKMPAVTRVAADVSFTVVVALMGGMGAGSTSK